MEQYEIKHMEMVRKVSPECMVLLKSNGDFPLDAPGKIALYGAGAWHTMKGGSGSGDVYTREFPTVADGLRHARFTITTDEWIKAYDRFWEEAHQVFLAEQKKRIVAGGLPKLMENLSRVMPDPERDIPMTGEGDTAVYVLSRMCGEGVDRDDIPGDLRLNASEIKEILYLQAHYQKFLLVLNTSVVVDLGPVADQVENILLLSQLGSAIGDAFADVLLGKASPSGKLSATWTTGDECGRLFPFGDRNDTDYTEGVYVGYRYFDSVGKRPLFPFGFGLSYTGFALKAGVPSLHGSEVSLPVTVRNTGSRSGKEVVQLYVSLPGKKLDQPWQVLAAFRKTRELAPGEEEALTLSFRMEELTSFDGEDCSRKLEAGGYVLRIGNSSRNTVQAGTVHLEAEAVTEQVSLIGGNVEFKDFVPSEAERAASAAMMAAQAKGVAAEGTETILSLAASEIKAVRHAPVKAPSEEARFFVRTLSDEQLAHLLTGGFACKDGADAGMEVPGAVGETTGLLRPLGVDKLIFSDGPAGVRIFRDYAVDEKGPWVIDPEAEKKTAETMSLLTEEIMTTLRTMYPSLGEDTGKRTGEVRHQYCTAIPVGTAIAQSWNPEVGRLCGEIVGEEMRRFHIDVWLAPALNIQRNPLCGRNFEYYSEDPLLSGRTAAAVIEGVQADEHLSCTIKHFICNNQENNRFHSSSNLSERALRDIYARGFEIAVKEAHPRALMTSYNLVNGVHTCENPGLVQTLLREEWGYEGAVMTDWLGGSETVHDPNQKYPQFRSRETIEAGVGVLMPGGQQHYDFLLEGLRDGKMDREKALDSAARMVDFAWQMRGKYTTGDVTHA